MGSKKPKTPKPKPVPPPPPAPPAVDAPDSHALEEARKIADAESARQGRKKMIIPLGQATQGTGVVIP